MVQSASDFLKQQGQTIKPIEKKKSFIQSAGDFLLSSEKSFGEDIGESLYLATGGQKKVGEIARKDFASGDQLIRLIKTTTDPGRKRKLAQMAINNYKAAGMTTENILGELKTNTQILGGAAGVLLDVLTAGTYSKAGLIGTKALTTGLQKGVPTILKGVVKEVAQKGGEQVIKKTGKEIAKTVLKDSLLGSTYGLVSTAQNKDATAKDYLTNAGIGAVAGAVIPPVFGATLKGAFKGTKFIAGKVGQLAEKTATGLEKFAIKEAEGTSSRFYENIYTKKPAITQKLAGVTAEIIRAGQKLPDQFATQFLDKYHTLGKFMAKAKKLGVETPDLKDMAQATKYRATGKAENKLDDYLNIRQIYKDDWATIKEYSHYLDDLDRLANGNKIAGDRTAEQVASDMSKLSDSIPLEKMAKIKDGQKELQSFLNNELIDAVDSGRLSPEQYRAIKAKHPNYVPHDVLDYLDEEGMAKSTGLGGTINVSKSGIEGAKGSTRTIDDIDNSITRRLYRQNILNEKNKTVKAVIDAGKEMEARLSGTTSSNQSVKGDLAQDISKAKASGQSFDEWVKGQLGKTPRPEIKILGTDIKSIEKTSLSSKEITNFWERGSTDLRDLYDSMRLSENSNTKEVFRVVPTNKKIEIGDFVFDNKIDAEKYINKYGERGTKIISQKIPENQLYTPFSKKAMLPEDKGEYIYLPTRSQLKAEWDGVNQAVKGDLAQAVMFKNITGQNIKPVDIPQGFEKIQYFNNGVREDWLVPDDVGRALKNLDGEEAGKVMSWLNNSFIGKVITTPANVLRKVSTIANPVFALFRNPVRDMQTAILTATDDYSKGLIKTITGKTDDAMYRLARESGALQGSIYREQLKPQQILAQKIQERAGIVKKLLRPDRLVEEYGQKMEEFTRLSVFKGALANGKTTEEAAKLARNATVDFGKSGNTIQVLNKVIPFLNARIQGFSNMGKAIVADPTKATRVLMWSAAYPQAVLTAYNSKYESYNGIPDYEKRKYWIIMVGENKGKDLDGKSVRIPNYIKIPKGEAQQAVSNTIERVLTLSTQKYPDNTSQFLAKLVGDISPVTDSSILPTGLQQAVELKSNYSFYKDKPIEGNWTRVGNKWYETKNLEPRFRTTLNTSQLAKQIGGFLNWSPTKIDYVIKTGVIGDIIRAYDLLPWEKTKEQIKENKRQTSFEKISELPFISGVVGSSYWAEQQAKAKAEAQKLKDKNTKKIQ